MLSNWYLVYREPKDLPSPDDAHYQGIGADRRNRALHQAVAVQLQLGDEQATAAGDVEDLGRELDSPVHAECVQAGAIAPMAAPFVVSGHRERQSKLPTSGGGRKADFRV